MTDEVKKKIELEIAHVLFIDIVAYSKLLINEQSELLRLLTDLVRETTQFRAAEAKGKLLRLATGDGMALVFRDSPETPVQCALELSGKLKAYPDLHVRMGIHSGPVTEVADVNEEINITGAGVNVAQWVMSCGDAGHILLSKHVADDLEQYPQWRSHLQELGECEVKHGARLDLVNLCTEELGNPEVPARFRALSGAKEDHNPDWRIRLKRWLLGILIGATLVIAGLAFYRYQQEAKRAGPDKENGRSVTVSEKSIAVLPFENRSEDKANAYFAEGVQDEIFTRLSKIGDLKVISRTSTQHYKSAPENLPEVAKQLGVANILEGSVQKSGDTVRVNVQLIKAANDSHIWAETFDRKLTDIFLVETEVARAIADQLSAHLTGREEQIITAKPTDNAEAYDAYLRGLAYSLKTGLSPADQISAQKYLREAVRLDPKFALAWSLLSQVDAVGYVMLFLQPTPTLREEAREAAETAVDLQPNLAEALHAKGWYHYGCLKDYDTAVRYFQQAWRLLPNSSQIPEALAYVARRHGEWDKSEVYFNQAEQLDPRNVSLLTQHAFSYIFLGRFPQALQKLEQVLDITPNDAGTLAEKALIAQAEGDLPRAATLLAPLHPAANDPFVLEAQVYQAILERRPAPIIPRLKEILANPDPTLGYLNGELRFWLGWAQELSGDHAAAQATWQQTRIELESFLEQQPENYILIGDLALIHMGLGDKAGALTLAERAAAANPVAKDAMDGSIPIDIVARVAAQAGESERAIAALEKVLSIPGAGAWALNIPLTPALLRLDPMFDTLRNDPRFQKLVASAPKESK